ncbi:MAG: translation initiation factor IF-2 [Candidatus Magasanikbacteria bacterium RIFOXYC2_FULL_42_28]|uniref:Translation initiation factor IF-2 n=1 Tax=Candidatus Magasanikbacteria bacterium RIFOXYC2_FULL_42_28 TaxID=1798704 RepID=A0A1F6NUL6_9BACT|nr:MAG: translation initiation factor IF-2 [Candidatus Magasanikbacteria bacterium RIFOXYC2_FULL_42_28]
MNVSELARKLRVHPKKLLEILPEFGFDIGARAVKVDDRVAEQITKAWRRIKFVLEQRETQEREKQKQLEKEQRQQSGAEIAVPSLITVREFADLLQMPINKLMLELMKNGILAAQNEKIDRVSATIIAEELGFNVRAEEKSTNNVADDSVHTSDLEMALKEGGTPRPPVVVVMGHVDHGKTKLLDAIRNTDVVAGEAGGITQHIGAYQVIWTNPKTKELTPLTFIDTPGHEAFTVMRSRGAKVADIAILVVAADDGVKPQTIEAINIIKAAKLPVVVAINKIDREGADLKRTRNDLSLHGLVADDWGGETPVVEISAKHNTNIDKLLDTVMLVADMNATAICAEPNRAAAGTVIDARVDKGQGPVATVLVQTGTLKVNDPLVINGEIYGKVRAMKNYRGENILTATPSTPIRILGFKVAPQMGDVLDVGKSAGASEVDLRAKRTAQSGAEQRTPVVVDEDDENKHQWYNVVVKADVLGSLEAFIASLEKLKNDEVGVKVVGKGLGNITADDVELAKTTGATIYGFNVNASTLALQMMDVAGVKFEKDKIIYNLLNLIKKQLETMLNPELVTTELGNFKVVQIFRTEKNLMIVGGRVEMGKLVRDCFARVKRAGEIVGKGKLIKLQSAKQDMSELPAGNEGGVQFEGKLELEVGDILEGYIETKKEKKLVLS